MPLVLEIKFLIGQIEGKAIPVVERYDHKIKVSDATLVIDSRQAAKEKCFINRRLHIFPKQIGPETALPLYSLRLENER